MNERGDAIAYLEAAERTVRKMLDWKDAHDRHDHADALVVERCLRDWRYLEHEAKVLIGSGPE